MTVDLDLAGLGTLNHRVAEAPEMPLISVSPPTFVGLHHPVPHWVTLLAEHPHCIPLETGIKNAIIFHFPPMAVKF